MEQEIIEVPYSDVKYVPTQVMTIDLPHPPTTTDDPSSVSSSATNQAQQRHGHSILYPHEGEHTVMTTLQPDGSTADAQQNLEDERIDNGTTSIIYTTTNTTSNISDNINSSEVVVNGESNGNDSVQAERTNNDSGEVSENNSNGSKSTTRFKWTKEKSQVAMNLVKHGCKPKLVSVAVGCSLRTAQKFVETVTPKKEGGTFKDYEIKRRGRKSKDVNHRLEAIKEVLARDASKTQVEIAADLKVSNTTVCRDLKRIGAEWKERREANNSSTSGRSTEVKRERRATNRRASTTTSGACARNSDTATGSNMQPSNKNKTKNKT